MYFLYSHFKILVNIKTVLFFIALFQIMLFFNELQAGFSVTLQWPQSPSSRISTHLRPECLQHKISVPELYPNIYSLWLMGTRPRGRSVWPLGHQANVCACLTRFGMLLTAYAVEHIIMMTSSRTPTEVSSPSGSYNHNITRVSV